MKLPFRLTASITTGLCLTIVFCPAAPTLAQKRLSPSDSHTRSRQQVPPDGNVEASFSNSEFDTAPSAKKDSLQPVSQQNVADAVLAEALTGMWVQVDRHFHKGEYNHAVNLNRIVVQGDPKNLEAYGNAAFLLWSTDRNDEAIAFLKQGLKANPNNYSMYDEIGAHYATRLRDYSTALPYFEQAVKYKCPFATWHSLARCYEKTNQWDKAVQAWATAAKYPNDALAPRRLERARAEFVKHQGNIQH